jgi:hydrogenase nickel incorporation protein HypA/HybF
MHEYSIVQALMDRIEAEARARQARAVRRVQVRIGELAGVEIALLRTAYDLCREGTICDTASLDVTTSPAAWTCSRCQTPLAVGSRLTCPSCGSPGRLESGDEILLERLELEVPG